MTNRELFDACREHGLFRAATDSSHTLPIMDFMQRVALLASNPLELVEGIPQQISRKDRRYLSTKDAFGSGQRVWRLQLPENDYMLFSEEQTPSPNNDGLPRFPVDVLNAQHQIVGGSRKFTFNAVMKSIH